VSNISFKLNVTVQKIPWLHSQTYKNIPTSSPEGEGIMELTGQAYRCSKYHPFTCALFYNTWFPVFRQQQLTYLPQTSSPNYVPVAWQAYAESYWRPKIGLIPAGALEYDWRENDCLNQEFADDFYTYVVWHFQVPPEDNI
jgi:hypothetical protein